MGHQNTEYTARCALYFFCKAKWRFERGGRLRLEHDEVGAEYLRWVTKIPNYRKCGDLGFFDAIKNLAENRIMCYTYDELGRVKLSTIKDLNGNVLSEESFNYDAAGATVLAGVAIDETFATFGGGIWNDGFAITGAIAAWGNAAQSLNVIGQQITSYASGLLYGLTSSTAYAR